MKKEKNTSQPEEDLESRSIIMNQEGEFKNSSSGRLLRYTWYRSTMKIDQAIVNKSTGILTIVFKGGKEYQYYGVKLETVEALYAAESAGKYFNDHINGKYNWAKTPMNGEAMEINHVHND